ELQKRPELQVIGELSDGLKAVQQAEELQPDLILLDIGLHNLNGIEAAKRIRKIAPDGKLLFVSLESSPKVVQETFRLSVQCYVQKQSANRNLLLAIDPVLEERKRFVRDALEFYDATEAQAPPRHEIFFCSDDATLLNGLTHFIA